jgi:hypothetical protein
VLDEGTFLFHVIELDLHFPRFGRDEGAQQGPHQTFERFEALINEAGITSIFKGSAQCFDKGHCLSLVLRLGGKKSFATMLSLLFSTKTSALGWDWLRESKQVLRRPSKGALGARQETFFFRVLDETDDARQCPHLLS